MHYAIPHAASAFLAREIYLQQRYLPFVTTLHGTDITLIGARRSFLPVTKFSIAQSDAVTAISQFLADETKRIFDYDQVQVIPNFINAENYSRVENAGLRKTLAPRDERLLMHVSNFRPVKRITDCIRTFAKMREHCDVCARLVMCGDGPERAEAERLARELGVANDVLFVGSVPNIRDYLSVADVFLLPSESESFGLAALEAMACEVPVIASRVGGLPEVVTHGETGFLAEVGDIEMMARCVTELFSDTEKRRAMGARARQQAVARFNTDRVIPQYIALYERVMAEAKKKSSGTPAAEKH
jgi:N-acetyl-alpha-D-glucosaminyl L-malate synthase BshA